jgi:hypothetical protein
MEGIPSPLLSRGRERTHSVNTVYQRPASSGAGLLLLVGAMRGGSIGYGAIHGFSNDLAIFFLLKDTETYTNSTTILENYFYKSILLL